MSAPFKVLVLAPASPFPPRDGVAIRLVEFLRLLDRLCQEEGRPCELELLVFGPPAQAPGIQEEALPFPFRGRLVTVNREAQRRLSPLLQSLIGTPTTLSTFRSTAFSERVQRAVDAGPHLLLAVGLQMAQHVPASRGRCRYVLDDFNVEWRVLERLSRLKSGARQRYWRWEAEKLRTCEGRLLRRADTVLTVSETDRQELQQLAPLTRLQVVGPSIPIEAAEDVRLPGEPPRIPCLVFTGAFNWHVNADAAVWFVREVLPALQVRAGSVRIYLVGKDPSPEVMQLGSEPGVTVTGSVPDVRPYLRQATVAVVPLRYGSGVRYKILEAFAAGTAVVSTSVGCEGLGITPGKHLLVEDDPIRFAEACASLIQRPSLRQELSAEAAAFLEALNSASAAAFLQVAREALR